MQESRSGRPSETIVPVLVPLAFRGRQTPARAGRWRRISLQSALVAVLVLGGCAHVPSDRFPTREHRRYPLALVRDGALGAQTERVVPYSEPRFVASARRRFAAYKARSFPIREGKPDVARYFTGIAHADGIPRGYGEVGEDQIGQRGLRKFVYSDGRVKNAYSIWQDGTSHWRQSVVYDDRRHVVVSGALHKGGQGYAWVSSYPPRGSGDYLSQKPLHIVHFRGSGRMAMYEVFEGGRLVRTVVPPHPSSAARGKLPCQARRYGNAVDLIIADDTIAPKDKVARIVPFLSYRPEANEEGETRQGSYSGLHHRVVASLGKIDCAEAFEALAKLLDSARFRSSAASGIAKHQARPAIPHLIRTLELEELQPVWSSAERNRHLVSAAIVRAMFEHSPAEAGRITEVLLRSRNWRYKRTIRSAAENGAAKRRTRGNE